MSRQVEQPAGTVVDVLLAVAYNPDRRVRCLFRDEDGRQIELRMDEHVARELQDELSDLLD